MRVGDEASRDAVLLPGLLPDLLQCRRSAERKAHKYTSFEGLLSFRTEVHANEILVAFEQNQTWVDLDLGQQVFRVAIGFTCFGQAPNLLGPIFNRLMECPWSTGLVIDAKKQPSQDVRRVDSDVLETLVDPLDDVECVRWEAFEYILQDLGDAKGFVAWTVVWRLLVLEWKQNWAQSR